MISADNISNVRGSKCVSNRYRIKGSINGFINDVPPAAADSLIALDERLDRRNDPAKPHWVYLLAFSRSDAFYIDTTCDVGRINQTIQLFLAQQVRIVDFERVRASRLVWFDTFETEPMALQRCAEIKATPHRWQRQLVSQFNPDWIDLDNYMIGFPFLSCIGERAAIPFKEVMNGPGYR